MEQASRAFMAFLCLSRSIHAGVAVAPFRAQAPSEPGIPDAAQPEVGEEYWSKRVTGIPPRRLLRSEDPDIDEDAEDLVERADDQLIPNIVFFTGRWDPNDVVDNNRGFVPPGTEFRYYNDSQVDASVRRISKILEGEANFKGAWEAYSNLRPWAYRIDLWRIMALWAHGGVYIDAKILFAQPLSAWVDQQKDSFALCMDAWPKHYFNAVLAARPRHPTALAILRQIVNNVQRRFYGTNGEGHADLQITGPGALTTALTKIQDKPRATCQLVIGDATVRGFSVDNRIVSVPSNETLMGSVRKVHEQMRSCSSCHSYSELFKKHAVYCDEPFNGTTSGSPCSSDRASHKLFATSSIAANRDF